MKPFIWLLAAAAASVPGVAGTDAWPLPVPSAPWGGTPGAAPMPGYRYPAEPAWPGYPSSHRDSYAFPGYGYGPPHPVGGQARAYGAPPYGAPHGDGTRPAYGTAVPAQGYGYGEWGGWAAEHPAAGAQMPPRRGEGGWWHPEPTQPAAPVRPWPRAAFGEPAQPYPGTTFWGAAPATLPPARGAGGYWPDRVYGDSLPPPPRPDWDREYPEADDLSFYPPSHSDASGLPWDLSPGYPQDWQDHPLAPDAPAWGAPDPLDPGYPPTFGTALPGVAEPLSDHPLLPLSPGVPPPAVEPGPTGEPQATTPQSPQPGTPAAPPAAPASEPAQAAAAAATADPPR